MLSQNVVYFQPKDLDASESQRLERIQAAKRIRRSKSAPSAARSGSVTVSPTQEEEETTSTTCLPNIFKMQQKSDKQKDKDKEESCADIPSPVSDPPPYDSVRHDHNENAHRGVTSYKSYQEDGHELREESTAPLLGNCEQPRQ